MEAGYDRARREGDSHFTSFLKTSRIYLHLVKRRTLKVVRLLFVDMFNSVNIYNIM